MSHVHDCEVLDGLIKAHGELDKSDKATRKSLKKEIEGAQVEMAPAPGAADGQFGHGAQAEMAPALGANNSPSESAMTPATPASDPLPAEDQTQDMEVDDYGTRPSLPSPVSHEDDDLLSGLPQSEATEVESSLAHLTVSSPWGPNG